MLPPQITSIYRQYKEDANSIASWLASNAKTYGFPADRLTAKTWEVPESLDSGIGRTKGIPKQQPLNASTGTPKTRQKAPMKYTVALEDFLPLAEWVASQKQPVLSVPPAFVATIDRLIKVRTHFGDMLESHETGPEAEDDHKQPQFLEVLGAVRNALRSRMPRDPASQATTAGAPTHTFLPSLAERLDYLSFTGPSDIVANSRMIATTQRPKSRKEDSAVYEVEAQTNIEDIMFVYLALQSDINYIRTQISRIWSDHSAGEVDHVAAAVSTNVAISLARELIEDSSHVLERHPHGIKGLIHAGFASEALRKEHSLEDIFAVFTGTFNPELYDIASKTYLFAFDLLGILVEGTGPEQLPLFREEPQASSPNNYHDARTEQENFRYDKLVLKQLFTELMAVIRALPDYPVEDELLRSLREADRTKEVSLSLAFAAQVLLDIHHIMGDGVERTFNYWANEFDLMICNIRRQIEHNEDVKGGEGLEAANSSLRMVLKRMQKMGQDPIHAVKAKEWARVGEMPEMKANRIMADSPVIAGLYLSSLRLEHRDLGVAMAGFTGSIRSTAHLYNALVVEGLLDSLWADLGVIINLLDEASIWAGGERPQTAVQYFDNYVTIEGISNSAFSLPRGGVTEMASKPRPQLIRKGVPVTRMFGDSFVRGKDSEWTTESLKAIMARLIPESEATHDENTRLAQNIGTDNVKNIETNPKSETNSKTEKKKKKKKKKSKARGGSTDATVHPVDLIEGLSAALHDESLETAFPYFLLHRWCWNLLRLTKAACDPILRGSHGHGYIEKEFNLPLLVGWILFDSAGGTGGEPDRRALQAAAETMRDMLASEHGGHVCTDIMQEKLGKGVFFDLGSEEDEE